MKLDTSFYQEIPVPDTTKKWASLIDSWNKIPRELNWWNKTHSCFMWEGHQINLSAFRMQGEEGYDIQETVQVEKTHRGKKCFMYIQVNGPTDSKYSTRPQGVWTATYDVRYTYTHSYDLTRTIFWDIGADKYWGMITDKTLPSLMIKALNHATTVVSKKPYNKKEVEKMIEKEEKARKRM